MRVLIQRVKQAWITIGTHTTPHAALGLLCLVGFKAGEGEGVLEPMANKLLHLRVFEDDRGRMNHSLLETGGDLVLVPQFTLYADCRKGRRPGFTDALEPGAAERLFDSFVKVCGRQVPSLIRGEFGAEMQVHLVNDGPVTILLDSDELGL